MGDMGKRESTSGIKKVLKTYPNVINATISDMSRNTITIYSGKENQATTTTKKIKKIKLLQNE